MMRTARGFTLLEVLMTVAVIGVLAGLIMSAAWSYLRMAEGMRDKAMLELVEGALDMYQAEQQHYPYAAHYKTGQLENAKMLYTELFTSHMQGKFPKQFIATDASDARSYFIDQYGNPVIYIYYDASPIGTPPGTWQGARAPYVGNRMRYELWSAGKDGVFDVMGTEGTDLDNVSNSIDEVVRSGV